MAKIAGVYMITNIANGKSYIGISNDIERRFGEHIRCSTLKKGQKSAIQSAIKRYGKDCFHFEILEVLENESDRLEAERMFIKRYDTFKNGYNLTEGGEVPLSLKGKDSFCYNSELVSEDIYNSYLKTRNISKVAQEFDCGINTVGRRIEEYCKDNNLEFPESIKDNIRNDLNDKQVYGSYLELGSADKVANKYDCSTPTIWNRINKYCLDNDLDLPKKVNSTNREDLSSEEVYFSYLDLKSTIKVADKFGCSESTVSTRIKQYCTDNGLELPKVANVSNRYDLNDKELYIECLKVNNYEKVGLEHNCSGYTIKRRIEKYCKDNNLEIPKSISRTIREDLNDKTLYDSYLELKSAKKVAKKFNCSPSVVYKRIKQYCVDNNLEVPKVVNCKNRYDLNSKSLYDSYLKLGSYNKVAQEFDCNLRTAKRRIEEYCSDNGIEVPKLVNAVNRPDLNDCMLYESYLQLGSYLAVARKFNCSDSTVKRRILKYKKENGL